MKSPAGFVSAAALATLLSPLTLAANGHGDAFMKKAMERNLAEIKVGQLAQQKGATEGVRHLGLATHARKTSASGGISPATVERLIPGTSFNWRPIFKIRYATTRNSGFSAGQGKHLSRRPSPSRKGRPRD